MDKRHPMLAARYVELNPVRAKSYRVSWRWRWASTAARLAGRDDGLVAVGPLLPRVDDWREYLARGLGPERVALLRRHERTGRLFGSTAFVK